MPSESCQQQYSQRGTSDGEATLTVTSRMLLD
jgi:hypothetical protein